ncbi:hypothetical protein G9A89_006472 [Geosiphon pyriformis]|nr:hypothetical protein G9A89_006472 [Geosiphon pyriformis]
MNKFDGFRVFTSGLDSGYIGSGVVIVMDIFLVRHVYKVSEVPGQLLSIKLLFKNKLSVSILGLYAGAFSAGEINSFIAKTVNKSSFVVLGGDFNENGLHKNTSFKSCLDLGLVNSLSILSNLVNAVVNCNVMDVSKHFNTDHWIVSVSVSLGSLLDTQLNSLYRQANKNCWKFDFRSADNTNTRMFANEFTTAVQLSDLDVMWNVLHKIMTLSAHEIFRKKWFKDFDGIFIRDFSRFHKLELLMSKLVKASHLVSSVKFASLLDMWYVLDANSASVVKSLFLLGSNFNMICSALAKVRKSYCSSKLLESRHAEETCIKMAINKKMESFESDKNHTIRNVLEHPFCKMILNYLVVGDELVLEPSLVKSRVNRIMKDWTRKCRPLKYVFNDAFSGLMCPVGVDELLGVVSNLSEGKTAGLFGISNKLWKHCDKSVLDMLLVLLNFCLICKSLYEWDGVFMNTRPIALIKTACKILSKIFLNRISLAYSTFDVLHENNFLVLRDTMTQSPIFAIGLVVENALEKSYELWLVLQNILIRIKMYNRFIKFFGGIHNDCINRVMTDFGLTDKYRVHDGLEQGEMFLPLLWCIFYDLLLCKVKRQIDGCEYRLNFYFISGCGHAKSWAGLFFFFAVGAFVDDTIWHILNIASEFFNINNISINNDKTVAILINCKIADPSLLISRSLIFIAKREKLYCYLEIYLLTEGLSKSSLAKAHSDVQFFANLVLKKAVSDKQFLYLVSAVFFPIIGYRTQFSYVPVSACKKWDTLISKGLKSKSGLPHDFPSNAIYHSSLYGLKTFEQI